MTAPMLEAFGLVRQFGGFTAVDSVDLTVPDGQFRAVIGPNGAGKSTLFALLAGALRPTAGTVHFRGSNITDTSPHARARAGMARTFQTGSVFPRVSVLDAVIAALLARRRKVSNLLPRTTASVRPEAYELLDRFGLGHSVHLATRELSHGDQRTLELALALAMQPKLVLLDEPTAGMSPAERRSAVEVIKQVVRDGGLTVVLCEHDVDLVFAVADVITVMNAGRVIAEGTPAEVRANPEVVRVYLGEE